MDRQVIQCRRCGGRMAKERTDFDHVHWVCECGFRDRTPFTRASPGTNFQQKGDLFARIRFQQGGNAMLEMPKHDVNDGKYELMSLDEISRLVSAQIPLLEILGEITEKIAGRMNVEVCSIYLNKGGQLVLSGTHGLSREAVGKVRLAIGEGITGAAAKTGKFVAVPDAAADPRYRHFAVTREEKYKAMLSYPISGDHGRVLGVINVQTVRSRNFTEGEIAYIAIVSNLIRTCLQLRDRVRDVPIDPPPDGR